jgi:hypothetical protein
LKKFLFQVAKIIPILDSSEELVFGFAEQNVDYALLLKIDFATMSMVNQMEIKSIAYASGSRDRYQRIFGKHQPFSILLKYSQL